MKKTIQVNANGKVVKRTINYIPFRYIISMGLIIFEIAMIIAIMIILALYVPYFWIAELITQIICIISIIGRKDNPDYKIPWLLFVFVVPIVGFMCYFMFYTRSLSKKSLKKINNIKSSSVEKNDDLEMNLINKKDEIRYTQAILLKKLSGSHLYQNTNLKYFSSGEKMFISLLADLESAKEYIFMEYFIIENGLFWNKILKILKDKAMNQNVEVYVVYDDIGCMMTLPGNYDKELRKYSIKAVPFSKLKGQANNEFNNRSHRKITVIDGKISYTGGINIADEYINHIEKFGHWKDVGIRLEGEATKELIRIFINDYNMNVKSDYLYLNKYCVNTNINDDGFVIPFGDGPKPLFERQVAKSIILSQLQTAKKMVYITTPYLIIDSELVRAIEDTALRGVDVRIITPHIPDKKLVFEITRSYYSSLIKNGVKIYEYKPGFIHAKNFIFDDNTAIVGTINLDYRSLVHHFENGVWIYNHEVIKDISEDFLETQENSIEFTSAMIKNNLFYRFIHAVLKIFTPLL